MKITVTAHCTYCARSFPVVDAKTEILGSTGNLGDLIFCDDNDGKLCCYECLCAYCGRGHVTDAEWDECDQFGVDNYGQDDPDVFRDIMRDVHAGVI